MKPEPTAMNADDDPHQVRELTDLLRQDDSMAGLRQVLTDKGLSPSATILAGLIDSEDNSEYGVILTADQRCLTGSTMTGCR